MKLFVSHKAELVSRHSSRARGARREAEAEPEGRGPSEGRARARDRDRAPDPSQPSAGCGSVLSGLVCCENRTDNTQQLSDVTHEFLPTKLST